MGLIRKEISKNKKQGIVPLTKLAMEQINKQKSDNPNSIVIFLNKNKAPFKYPPNLTLNRILKNFKLKYKGCLFHLMRHTAGSLWLQGKNIDGTNRHPLRIELVSEILRHSNINITKQIYAQFDKSDIITAFLN